MATEAKRKKVYLELLRILCAALVILNHIGGYSLYQTIDGIRRVPCLFLTMFTRINVPVFFMISGSLLLGKQEDYGTVYKKRVVRIILLIIFAQIAFYCCMWFKKNILAHGHSAFSLGELFRGILSGKTGPSAYWFLYSYLGFLMLLPISQRIARGMNRQEFIILLCIHFLFSSFIPIVNLIASIFSIPGISLHAKFVLPIATKNILFYPLVGYYLDNKVDVRAFSKRTLWLIAALALLGIGISSACTWYQGVTQGKFTQDYVMLFDYVTAIAVFLLAKRFMLVSAPGLSEGKTGKLICFVGSLTVGIYVFDPMLRQLFMRYFHFSKYRLMALVTSLEWIALSMTVCGLLTWLLRFIPGMKKIL